MTDELLSSPARRQDRLTNPARAAVSAGYLVAAAVTTRHLRGIPASVAFNPSSAKRR